MKLRAVKLLQLRAPGVDPALTLRRLLKKYKGDAGLAAQALGLVTSQPLLDAVDELGLREWFAWLSKDPFADVRKRTLKRSCSACGELGHYRHNKGECRGFRLVELPTKVRRGALVRFPKRTPGRPAKYRRLVSNDTIESMRQAAWRAVAEWDRAERDDLIKAAREDLIAFLDAAAVAMNKPSLALELMQCSEALERAPQLDLARGLRREAAVALRSVMGQAGRSSCVVHPDARAPAALPCVVHANGIWLTTARRWVKMLCGGWDGQNYQAAHTA